MAFIPSRYAPGQKDVNDGFSSKGVLNMLLHFKSLGANYRFGDLSARHCNLNENHAATWRKLVDQHYPADVQAMLKSVVSHALTHKDANGHSKPIPIEWKWRGKSRTVKVTYKRSKYKIELGFPPPLAMRLAQRRENAKSKK